MAAATSKQRAVPAEQRVFSLVLALVASANGATKRELLSSVYGYADRYVPGMVDEALERQFERDKEQLRALGVPIETVDSPLEPGNTQLIRYRIAKEQLQTPPHVRFTSAELMLLRAAGLAWSEGSLSAESRRAAMKLESLGARVAVERLGARLDLASYEPQAPALQRAIDEGRVVRFAYQVPAHDAPLERVVAPLHLHRADGRWHLIGWDQQREAERVFLLARMSGQIRIENQFFDAELRERVPDAVARLAHRAQTHRATVRVQCGSIAEARLLPRAVGEREPGASGARQIEFGMLDDAALADELVSYGAEVQVLAPAQLRQLVVNQLEQISRQHAALPSLITDAEPGASAAALHRRGGHHG